MESDRHMHRVHQSHATELLQIRSCAGYPNVLVNGLWSIFLQTNMSEHLKCIFDTLHHHLDRAEYLFVKHVRHTTTSEVIVIVNVMQLQYLGSAYPRNLGYQVGHRSFVTHWHRLTIDGHFSILVCKRERH